MSSLDRTFCSVHCANRECTNRLADSYVRWAKTTKTPISWANLRTEFCGYVAVGTDETYKTDGTDGAS